MDYVLLLFFSLSWDSWSRFWIYNFYIMIWNFHYLKAIESLCSTPSLTRNVIQFSCSLYPTWPTNYTLRSFCTPSSFLFPGTRSHMLTILLHLPSSNFYHFSYFLSILQYDSLLATMTKCGTCQHFPADFPVPSSSSTTTIALSLSCQHRVNGVDTARWLDSGPWSFQSPRWSIGFRVDLIPEHFWVSWWKTIR